MVWKNEHLARSMTTCPPRILFLTMGVALTVLPHFSRMPFWVSLAFALMASWRLRADMHRDPCAIQRVNAFSRFLIVAAIIAGILFSYGTLVGRDAGVALLILLAGMKLIELQQQRDYYVTCFLGLFLVITSFLYSQTLLSALYMALTVLVLIAALVTFNDERQLLSNQQRAAYAARLMLQALPLMLILFVLFPRIPGPLWGLPKDAHAGKTGLDDQMSPGSISGLTLSDEVAFRVEFKGPVPAQSSLYWRGPVLWKTDGLKWVPALLRGAGKQLQPEGDPVSYTITLEPTNKPWVYALELPVEAPIGMRISHDFQVRAATPVRTRQRYTLTSYPDSKLLARDRQELRDGLQLPRGRHPRSIALAEDWKNAGLSTEQIVQRALRMFNGEQFFYSLAPPVLLTDPVDQFLFETREGFCEHYAASFVVLMRAAGIPARVVTGYQGGTLNPVGNYLIVRQRDAHAWAEIWLQDRGWQRVDPTAAVAPERIRVGIESAFQGALIDVPQVFQDSVLATTMWRRFRYTWDAVNNRWNQWVLGYDATRQSLFLQRIGLGWLDHQGLMFALLSLFFGVLLIVGVWLLRQGRPETDDIKHLFNRFCARLDACGIRRAADEGALDFARRVAMQRADLADAALAICTLYSQLRYADRRTLFAEFKQRVRMFRPPANQN